MKLIKSTNNLDFYTADTTTELGLPFAENIRAGFPSPAEEYIEQAFDLNKELIKNPSSTFYGRVRGSSMIDAGINEGDILVIDKSIYPNDGKRAICYIDGEFTLKTLKVTKDGIYLLPANSEFEPIKITPENEFMVWGIVTYVIHKI
jgi:DNA polymerase V